MSHRLERHWRTHNYTCIPLTHIYVYIKHTNNNEGIMLKKICIFDKKGSRVKQMENYGVF